MKHKTLIFVLIILFGVSIISCRRTAFQVVYPSLSDGRYDSEFPYRNCSEELDDISKSVKKIYCLVEYDIYHFEASQKINLTKLREGKARQMAVDKGFFSESVHGSATVIYNENNRLVVLTAAHILDYPDTVFSYFMDAYNKPTAFLESISVKKKQSNFIRDLPDNGLLEIIALDSELDIAFLGNSFPGLDRQMVPVFGYPVGDSKELEWGSFVYIMGYPAGYQMVTRGIVSNPFPNNKGEFIIDALFNQGISGGVVLAVRDGVPNFELVGIAKSVSAKYKNVIKPAHDSHQEVYNANVPYEGDLFVKVEKELNYGITFTIAIGTIRDFYFDHRSKFIENGYYLDGFFSNAGKK